MNDIPESSRQLRDVDENFGGSNTAHADIGISDLDAYNNYLIGRILTTLEVSPLSETQLKALKQLIKQDLWSARDKVWSWMSRQKITVVEGKAMSTNEPFPYLND